MPTPWLTTFVTVLSGGMVLWAMQNTQAPGIEIDHVILGVNDLERGIQQFVALTGVTPERGGEHPGRGTQNALASLDDGRYLEILAPAASRPAGAPRDPYVEHETLTVVGWALQSRAIGGLVERLRAAGFTPQGPRPGSRRAPGGALLEWQVASVAEPGLELAPFFIEWSRDTTHPSVGTPGGCRLGGMELTHPAPARLQAFFTAAGFQAVVDAGERPGMRLTLDCPGGRVEFTS